MTTRVALMLPGGGTEVPVRVIRQVFVNGNWVIENMETDVKEIPVGSLVDYLYVYDGCRIVIEEVTD